MSTNKADWFEWFLLGGLVLPLAIIVGGLTIVSYEQTREKGIKEYQQALDANLTSPYTKNLNQIRAGLRQWMVSYGELKVPTSYTNVYKKVESALTEANALTEGFPTMLAPDFERDLGSLRTKVAVVPQISSTLYSERNPWLSGFLLFILIEGLKIVGALALVAVVIVAMCFFLQRDSSTEKSSSTSSAGTTSSGGSYYGGMGGYGGYGGNYGGEWNYPPTTYRPPPFWW